MKGQNNKRAKSHFSKEIIHGFKPRKNTMYFSKDTVQFKRTSLGVTSMTLIYIVKVPKILCLYHK